MRTYQAFHPLVLSANWNPRQKLLEVKTFLKRYMNRNRKPDPFAEHRTMFSLNLWSILSQLQESPKDSPPLMIQ